MKLLNLYILITALFFSVNKCVAQDTATDQDSTVDEIIDPNTRLVDNGLSLVPDSVKALKDSKQFAYAKHLDSLLMKLQDEELKGNKTPKRNHSWLNALFDSGVLKILFWSVAVLFVLFILYRLFFAKGFFQKQSSRSPVIEIKPEEENLSLSADYPLLIKQAVEQKDFRLAIRYHFLLTLQKLASTNQIQFAADKTNHQYIIETAGKPFNQNLILLTHQYEYVWYGGFQMDAQRFEEIERNFNLLNENIR